MTQTTNKKDTHIPTWALSNFIRRRFGKPNRYNSAVSAGQVVADLGCGPGFYTFPLADEVGPSGKVYAVDSDEKAIQVIENKASRGNYHNIETHTSSAANLGFIESESVDFVLGDGLLCCVAPQDHAATVREIIRILKPGAKAYLVTGRSNISYMGDEEWEDVLKEFNVEGRNFVPYKGDRWAWVTRR
ncbi:MAG: class I SAM-dependent methyltransferase [Acidobacteriaceae bacterium]